MLVTVVREEDGIDSFLQNFVAAIEVQILLRRLRDDLDELPVFSPLTHDFDPVALILSCLIDELTVGLLGLQISDDSWILCFGIVYHLVQFIRLRICCVLIELCCSSTTIGLRIVRVV